MRVFFRLLLVLGFFMSHAVRAEELMYPELQVSPKASDRLKMEADDEPSAKWTRHLPVQTSALATVIAGVVGGSDDPDKATDKQKDQNNWASRVGIGVGAAWLATTVALSMHYSPYQSGYKEISGLPVKSKQEQLVKERLAEEKISDAARLGKRLTWISIVTNLGASAFIASSSGNNGQIMGGVAAALSFAPLVFPYRWQTVDCYHKDYKKKIYGPVASASLLNVAGTKDFVPGFTLGMQF